MLSANTEFPFQFLHCSFVDKSRSKPIDKFYKSLSQEIEDRPTSKILKERVNALEKDTFAVLFSTLESKEKANAIH